MMGTKRDENESASRKESTRFPARENTESPAADLDDLDTSILRYLERNGRATNYEVGEAVGLSASAASRRIQALEVSGAIRGYRALIDDRMLGKRRTVYIRVTLERQSAAVLSAFEAAIPPHQGHRGLSPHWPDKYDYMLVARVSGIDDYGQLHQNEALPPPRRHAPAKPVSPAATSSRNPNPRRDTHGELTETG